VKLGCWKFRRKHVFLSGRRRSTNSWRGTGLVHLEIADGLRADCPSDPADQPEDADLMKPPLMKKKGVVRRLHPQVH
jgi:hypothetical protein